MSAKWLEELARKISEELAPHLMFEGMAFVSITAVLTAMFQYAASVLDKPRVFLLALFICFLLFFVVLYSLYILNTRIRRQK